MKLVKQSFSKAKRLTQTAEFTAVKFQGKTYRGSLLILGVLAQKEEKAFRAGFITTKKLGGAVVANRCAAATARHRADATGAAVAGYLAGCCGADRMRQNATHQQLKDEWLHLAERASILAP